MRNSRQSNTSQRRGQKSRRPGGSNDRRSGQGQRQSSANGQRNGSKGFGNGQRSVNRNRARNEISQAWASDTSTLSSHMPTLQRNGQNRKNDSRSGQNPRSKNGSRPNSGINRSGYNDRGGSRNFSKNRDAKAAPREEQTNRQTAPGAGGATVGNIEPFELFCAYHLGITKDKGYRPANINEVANRFRTEPAMIKQALKEYDMDPESLMDREFDMALAQLDIQVAPEGVDRLELARGIYEEFQNAPRIKRDWNKILEEDRKENRKIFDN